MTLLRSIENADYSVMNGVLFVLDPGARQASRVRGSFACSGAGWVAAESAAHYLRVRLESHDTEPAAAPGERLDEMSLPFTGVTGEVHLAWLEHGPIGPALTLPGPGAFRVRVVRRPADDWLLQFWPVDGRTAPPRWTVRSSAVAPGLAQDVSLLVRWSEPLVIGTADLAALLAVPEAAAAQALTDAVQAGEVLARGHDAQWTLTSVAPTPRGPIARPREMPASGPVGRPAEVRRGAPVGVGVVSQHGRRVSIRRRDGTSTSVLLPDDAPTRNAWETARGMLLRTTTAALLVRADGTVAVLGEQVTPNVLRSPDGRHLVITEKHTGRDQRMRLRLLDLEDDTEHVMPWPTGDLTVRAAGLHERTVYFAAGGRPGLTMRWTPGMPPYPLKSTVWAVDSNTGAMLNGDPAGLLRLTAPDGATRATAANPHFTFTPAGELFALQSEPPAIHLADADPRLIKLPTSARDSTIANCPIWESERHLLLTSAGASDAVRVDMQTGECELAAMPAGVPAQPLF